MNVLYGPSIFKNTHLLQAYNDQQTMLNNDLYQLKNRRNFEQNRILEDFFDAPNQTILTGSAGQQSMNLSSTTDVEAQQINKKIELIEDEKKRAMFALSKTISDTLSSLGNYDTQNNKIDYILDKSEESIESKSDQASRVANDIDSMTQTILIADRAYYRTQYWLFILKSILAFLASGILIITLNKAGILSDNATITLQVIIFIIFAIVLFTAMTKSMRDDSDNNLTGDWPRDIGKDDKDKDKSKSS